MVTYPQEWQTYPFKIFFRLIPNNTLSRDKLSTSGAIGNIHYGDVLIKYGDTISDLDDIPRVREDIGFVANNLLQKNDVIVADTAEDETVGKVTEVGDISIPLVGGLHTVVCRPNEETASGYLGYYMNSRYYHDQLLPYITGIKVSSVSKKSLNETELTLPSNIQEQQNIVRVLNAFDTYIDNLIELIEKKRGIRDGAINDLLSATMRLSGFDKPWKETTLGKEYAVIMGQSPNSASYNSSGSGVPLVQGNADIENRVTTPKRYTSMPTKICENGDTILAVRAPVGTVSRANQRVCLGRGVCAISGMHKDFIYYLMYYYESAWETFEQGSTFTAVSGKEVRNFEIKVPEEGEEQDAISRILIAMDEEIEALENERDKMIQIREGAMDDLLTGRVRLGV